MIKSCYLKNMDVVDDRHPLQWRILMSGSGNSAFCYAMNKSWRLCLETREIVEISSRFQILLEEWGFTGMP